MIRRAVLILAGTMISACAAQSQVNQQPPGKLGQLVSVGEVSRGGIFDPSVADTPPGQRAWMSYSAVDPSPRWPTKNSRTITTRLAYSDDRGATWKDLGSRVNELTEVEQSGRGGTWSNEVSSLVFDTEAPAEERWKLFWHHYLTVDEDRKFENGWIGYKTAATPEGLREAKEVKLFGAKGYKELNDRAGGVTGSPLGGPPAIQVHRLQSDGGCIVLSEPGVMATPSGIYFASNCFEFNILPPGITSKIVLLKCASPCHPTSPAAWRFAGTFLRDKDASAFGGDSFSGSDLFTQNGQAYLIVSPVSSRPVHGAYNGCLVFRIADLETAKLEQTQGRFVPVKEIRGRPNTFNGACTYAPAVSAAGFIYGEIKFADKPLFQIYRTGDGL